MRLENRETGVLAVLAGMTEDEFIAALNRRSPELPSDPRQDVPFDEVRNTR
jgi:hypothetical protein